MNTWLNRGPPAAPAGSWKKRRPNSPEVCETVANLVRDGPRISVGAGTLRYAVLRRPVEPGQYVSIRYSERLAEAGIEPSVGSTGDSYDNALAETINGLYKAEIIHRRGPWKTREAVELATLEWVSWFNHHRLLEPIGYIPPAEAEASYWRQQGQARSANRQRKTAASQEG
jgi:putative transposase